MSKAVPVVDYINKYKIIMSYTVGFFVIFTKLPGFITVKAVQAHVLTKFSSVKIKIYISN